jgi:hypothetical protein
MPGYFSNKNPPLHVLGVQQRVQRQGLPQPGGAYPYRFGNMPLPSGAPGNPLYPYDENGVWNGDGSTGGGVVSAPPPPGPPSATGLDSGTATGQPASAPYGESDRAWTNPTTYASISLAPLQIDPTQSVLNMNYKRNSLIIQNQCSAGGSDTAPTLYVGFNAQAIPRQSLALSPGVGFFWDILTPRDSIYIAFAGTSNLGGSVVFAGVVIQGTYVP